MANDQRLCLCGEPFNARELAIRECIAVARHVAGPFVSPTAEEIIVALEALVREAQAHG